MTAENVLTRQRNIDSLVETLVGFALLLGVNVIWYPEDPGFLDMAPHPFFIVILLIAARYGTFSGFFASLIAAWVYAVFFFEGKEFDSISWEHFYNPYLFILVGTVVGEFRQMAADEMEQVKRHYTSASDELDRLRSEAERAGRINLELQERIAGTSDTVANFYDSAASLESLDQESVYPAVLKVVQKFTGAEKSSVYVRKRRAFALKARRGWVTGEEFAQELPFEHPLVARVLKEGHSVAFSDAGLETLASGSLPDVLMVAPLRIEDETKITALLVVNRLPLPRLGKPALRNLSIISRWAAAAISRGRKLEATREGLIDDPEIGIYRYHYLERRLTEECERAKRYGGTFSLVFVWARRVEDIPDPDRRRDALRQIGAALKKCTRTVDLTAVYKKENIFALLLPATPRENSMTVVSRIQERFQREVIQHLPSRAVYLTYGVAGFAAPGKTPAEMMAEAERFQLVAEK